MLTFFLQGLDTEPNANLCIAKAKLAVDLACPATATGPSHLDVPLPYSIAL